MLKATVEQLAEPADLGDQPIEGESVDERPR
jgi:hypothetical protein